MGKTSILHKGTIRETTWRKKKENGIFHFIILGARSNEGEIYFILFFVSATASKNKNA